MLKPQKQLIVKHDFFKQLFLLIIFSIAPAYPIFSVYAIDRYGNEYFNITQFEYGYYKGFEVGNIRFVTYNHAFNNMVRKPGETEIFFQYLKGPDGYLKVLQNMIGVVAYTEHGEKILMIYESYSGITRLVVKIYL